MTKIFPFSAVVLGALVIGLAAGPAEAAEPTLRLDLGGGVAVELVWVRAGGFSQGSPAGEAGRAPDETQRQVRLTTDYYMGRSAITRAQWERFVGETGFRTEAETGTSGGYGWNGTALVQDRRFTWRNPGFSQTPAHPVCLVTYPDAQAFCAWLQRRSGRAVSLPTEAQWEYACRAGTETPWSTGTTPPAADRGPWHKGNSGNTTHPVDAQAPNPWGVVIGGNVSEWCLDWYAPYPPAPAVDPRQDNPNLSDKPRRVLRGGSWLRDANNTRSAARYRADPRSRNADIGFRIVCATAVNPPPPVPTPPVPRPPQAEAEPGDPPRPAESRPAAIPAAPPSRRVVDTGFRIGNIFGGLLCVLLPAGVVVLLIMLGIHSGKRGNDLTVRSGPAPSRRRPLIRKVSDGFWIDGDWPLGTALRLHYLVNGAPTDMELTYRPGPEGQFVFTGTVPESVSVVPDSADPLPAALFASPPSKAETREDRSPPPPRPPFSPTAY